MIIRTSYNVEELLSKVSTYDLFKKHCPNFQEVGAFFKSEFRNETKPSCLITPTENGLKYQDFGESYRQLDIIDYVKRKYNTSFQEALEIIANDTTELCKNPTYLKTLPSKLKKECSTVKDTILDIRKRAFNKKDMQYWGSVGWSLQMLVESKTIPISYFWIDNQKGRRCIKAAPLAYSYDYYFHNGIFRRKIYQPKSKLKWVSNVDDTIVQLVNVMPKKGDILFITSSQKDAGIFWRLNLDRYFPNLAIHGVAPNSESTFVPECWLLKQKERWNRIIIWYDNDFSNPDNPGITNAKKFAEKYNLEYYFNPSSYRCKDPSDLVSKYGLHEFYNLVNSTIYAEKNKN